MPQPMPPPARVRCNRGFGWSFWMVMGVIAVVGPVMFLGSAPSGPGLIVGLGLCLVVAGMFILTKVLLLPRLEFLPASGALRNRRHTVPFSAIARIIIRRERAGVWVRFVSDDDRTLARMSLGESLCAKPTSEQWMALGHAISSAAHARGVPPTAVSDHRYAMAPGHAADIATAQAIWLLRGHDKPEPAKSLLPAVIDLRV